MLIDATKSSLLIVDVQERLLPVMAEGKGVVEACKNPAESGEGAGCAGCGFRAISQGLGPYG